MHLSLRQTRFVYLIHLPLLICFSGSAQPKSSTSDLYELTCYAGYDGRLLIKDLADSDFDGLKIHAFVKADVPFAFTVEDVQSNRLSISGTVIETDAQDFCLTNSRLQGFGMSAEGLLCDSKETREMRKSLEAILGPDSRYNPSDPAEAESSIWCISIGPGYRLAIKRTPSQPQLTMTPSRGNVILAWSTNFTGFNLQSTTNPASLNWNTVSSAAVWVNGFNVVTNPVSGNQQFFRLSR